jgi:hypothetical protein
VFGDECDRAPNRVVVAQRGVLEARLGCTRATARQATLRSSQERQPQGRRGSRSQLKYRKQPHAK